MSERVRRAEPAEAADLTALALRSKAYWGYDPEFMEACRAELTLTAEFIGEREVYVLENAGRVQGYYALKERGPDIELDHLYVDPPAIGRGLGGHLWRHAVERASSLGFGWLLIESDPHAEGFYRKLGAERIGDAPSGSIPGRRLPLLRYGLTDRRNTVITAP
jgi:GNAT superfamily N-acetyltransferase